MALRALIAIGLAWNALGADVSGRTQLVIGLRHSLFPEKDNTARLSRVGRKQADARRVKQNEDLKKRAEDFFEKSPALKSMALLVVPFVHGEPEARSLLEQVRGKVRAEAVTGPLADMAILPQTEWDALRKDFPELESFAYKKTDGRGGNLAVVFQPDRVKSKVAAFDRIDKITDAYVEDLLTKKLGLHPGETTEIANRLKAQVRQTLEGRGMERKILRGLSDQFVTEHLGPELNGKWTGHDPQLTETTAHDPGERETASSGAGHTKTVPTEQ
jgi:hypothetical protein